MLIRPDPASVLESVPEGYTPGPLHVAHHGTWEVESATGARLADCGTIDTARADAMLYAQAPALVAALRVALEQRDGARERALEAERVCDQPGCRAAVVRRDDGARVCGAGHASRWVERAELDAAHRGYAAYVATTERENDKELAAIQRLVKERDDARRERDEAINRAETWDQTLRPMCIDLATIDAVLAGTEDAPVEEGEVAARVLALREERDEARQHAEESEEVLGRIEEELDRAVSIRAPRRDGDDDHRIVRAVVRLREERDDARRGWNTALDAAERALAAILADLRERTTQAAKDAIRARRDGHPIEADQARDLSHALAAITLAHASAPAGEALARVEREAEERGRLAGVGEERAQVVAWLREQAEAEARQHRAMYATDALLLAAGFIESGAHEAKEDE